MRHLALLLLLSGCSTTTTVSQRQDYTMPTLYTVTVAVVPLAAVRRVCVAPGALGCSYWTTDHRVAVWLSDAEYARHEFDHLIFGPLHR